MFITNLRYESLYFYPTAAKQMERYDFSGLCMYDVCKFVHLGNYLTNEAS